jgi:hypothetical protein
MSSAGLAQRAGDRNAGRDFYGPAGSYGAGLTREGRTEQFAVRALR